MDGGDENGPNDARCVVWAIGMSFFFPSCSFNLRFILCLGSNYVIKVRGGGEWAALTKRAQTMPDALFAP
jgi:hypothetical protein